MIVCRTCDTFFKLLACTMDILDSKTRWIQLRIRVPVDVANILATKADKLDVTMCDFISFLVMYGAIYSIDREVISACSNYRRYRLFRQCYARSIGVKKRMEGDLSESRREKARRLAEEISTSHVASRRHKRSRACEAGDERARGSVSRSSSEAGTELREPSDGSSQNKRTRHRSVLKSSRRGRRKKVRYSLD